MVIKMTCKINFRLEEDLRSSTLLIRKKRNPDYYSCGHGYAKRG
jgi:hypothetical protein